MDFHELSNRALTVRQHYAAFEQATYGRVWTTEEIALGFVGDVGDLMKLILAQQGVRDIPDARAKLGHELADCLWSLLVIAAHTGINLEQEFVQTMDQLEQRLSGDQAVEPGP